GLGKSLRGNVCTSRATFAACATSFAWHATSFARHATSFARHATSFAWHATSFARHATSFARRATSFARHATSFARHAISFARLRYLLHGMRHPSLGPGRKLSGHRYGLRAFSRSRLSHQAMAFENQPFHISPIRSAVGD